VSNGEGRLYGSGCHQSIKTCIPTSIRTSSRGIVVSGGYLSYNALAGRNILMEVDHVKCPVCGMPTVPGFLGLVGRSNGKFRVTGSLWWESDKRIPRKHPLKIFGKVYFATKPDKYRLLREESFFASDESTYAKGLYCPSCKKVYAEFNVPD
jgi:hypothetical protein